MPANPAAGTRSSWNVICAKRRNGQGLTQSKFQTGDWIYCTYGYSFAFEFAFGGGRTNERTNEHLGGKQARQGRKDLSGGGTTEGKLRVITYLSRSKVNDGTKTIHYNWVPTWSLDPNGEGWRGQPLLVTLKPVLKFNDGFGVRNSPPDSLGRRRSNRSKCKIRSVPHSTWEPTDVPPAVLFRTGARMNPKDNDCGQRIALWRNISSWMRSTESGH
ncbi:hypothetical protein B0H16DRAFT_1467972 [Mycena metata]|uniref:Uncharacterized protein n=1 Tax=Mycena metata TaxID=1033252 RepID=A0AAD7MWF2_9AGAR|nr:hypothetical protein B0H16DRAFT_1467972 [Mycena metata]